MQYHFYRMCDSGLLDAINAVLVAGAWVTEGREAGPTASMALDLPVQRLMLAKLTCSPFSGR